MPLLTTETDEHTTITQYLKSIFIMPRLMQMLCLTNLLSWMAFVSYCLYFTDFVGEAVFMGDPMVEIRNLRFESSFHTFRLLFVLQALPGTESLSLYQTGVRFGCWGLAVFALSCSVYSMVIENLMNLVGSVCHSN